MALEAVGSSPIFHPMKKALAFASAFFNEAHLRCMNNEAGLRPMKRGFSARRRKRGRFASCSPKANVSRQRSCRFMFAEQTLHSFYCRGGYYPPARAGGACTLESRFMHRRAKSSPGDDVFQGQTPCKMKKRFARSRGSLPEGASVKAVVIR